MKNYVLLAATCLVLINLHPAPAAPAQEQNCTIVATTTWTAAFARAAGLEDVCVLAPARLRHPPEYELKPSDVATVSSAELVIYAGYEVMVSKLQRAVGEDSPRLLRISTSYDLPTITASLRSIAREAGDPALADDTIRQIAAFYDAWRDELAGAGLDGAPVLVHFFQKPLVEELGFDIQGVFGPGSLEASQIVQLSSRKISLVIDNWHNPVGSPLEETLPGVPRVSFINFPGPEETGSLLEVLRCNRARLSSSHP